ncbi:hypothetical protein DNTS_009771, partial [Danionella cerebrum]
GVGTEVAVMAVVDGAAVGGTEMGAKGTEVAAMAVVAGTAMAVALQRDSPVWAFCFRGGVISGRCCIKSNSSKIVGLDLSNCSISHVEHLYDASTAVIMFLLLHTVHMVAYSPSQGNTYIPVRDLSSNPISSLTDTVFQGFSSLTQL